MCTKTKVGIFKHSASLQSVTAVNFCDCLLTSSPLFVSVACPRPACQSVRRPAGPLPWRPWEQPEPEPLVPSRTPCVPAGYLVPAASRGGLAAGLDGLRCRSCGWCLALRVGPLWTPLETLLRDTQRRSPGWHPVTSVTDRAAVYILSAFIYGERERSLELLEPRVAPPPLTAAAFLLISEDGEAAGFATVKQRGQPVGGGGAATYSMDVLEFVFVRRRLRCRGLALGLLHQLTRRLAMDVRRRGQLGVAWPTAPLRRLLRRLVRGHRWARRLLYTVTSAGEPTNVWDGMVKEQLEAVNDVWERQRQLEASGSEGEEEEGCSTPPDQRWSRRSRSSTPPSSRSPPLLLSPW